MNDQKKIGICCRCAEPIFTTDSFILRGGEYFHERCFDEFVEKAETPNISPINVKS